MTFTIFVLAVLLGSEMTQESSSWWPGIFSLIATAALGGAAWIVGDISNDLVLFGLVHVPGGLALPGVICFAAALVHGIAGFARDQRGIP